MSNSNSLAFIQFEKQKKLSWFSSLSNIVHLPKFEFDLYNLNHANLHVRNPLDPTQASSPPSTTMILTFEGRVFAAGRRCAMQLRVIQTLPSSQTLPDLTSAFPRPPSRQLGFDPLLCWPVDWPKLSRHYLRAQYLKAIPPVFSIEV